MIFCTETSVGKEGKENHQEGEEDHQEGEWWDGHPGLGRTSGPSSYHWLQIGTECYNSLFFSMMLALCVVIYIL